MVVKKEKTKEKVHHISHQEISNNLQISHYINKISGNFWQVSTVVLALLLITILFMNIGVGKNKAGEKVLTFLNEQTGGGVSLVSVDKKYSMYEVLVSYQGQEIPVYLTEDGKNLVQGIVPLTADSTSTTSTSNTDSSNANNNQIQDLPKSEKPVVELFVMAYCPYGTQTEKGIIPVAELLKDKIDFQIKFVYYAMHPSYGEVEEQLLQYCMQKEQKDKYLFYLKCFLKEGNSSECLTEAKIDSVKLKTCTTKIDKEFNVTANLNDKSSWLSGNFPKFNINLADNEKYQIRGSPTLIINGQETSVGRDSNNLLKAVCSSFLTRPAECSQTLSSETPSSGFGYSTTSSTNTDAACGV